MKWIDVRDELPEQYEHVLIWVRYEGEAEFCWTESNVSHYEKKRNIDYKEPNSGVYWNEGCSKNYVITHWMYIEEPKPRKKRKS